MPATLSEKAEDVLLDLPPDVADDPLIQRIIDAVTRELARIEEYLTDLAQMTHPQNATDEYRLLGLWEAFLGLPVEAAGVALEARRSTLLTAIGRRYAGAGKGWKELVTQILEHGAWTYAENSPGPYQLTITIPTLAGYQAGRLVRLLVDITPAHLQIFVSDGTGFIIGVDRLGDEL